MKIGLIVEGAGELEAFKALIPKIKTTHQVIHRPARADMQPRAATAKAIARSAQAAVAYWLAKGIDLIVVLIDSEGDECPVDFSKKLKVAFSDLYPDVNFEVVVKEISIENWLIADPAALVKSPKRFSVTPAFTTAVSPNKADGIKTPQRLLGSVILKGDYQKGKDPEIIMKHQDPLKAAQNSRSFRRFLRVIGCTTYSNQSKFP